MGAPVDPYNQAPVVNPDLQAYTAAVAADPQSASNPQAAEASPELQAAAVAADPQAADDGEGSQALVKGPEGPSDLQAAAVAADPQTPVVATDLQVSAAPANPAEPQAAEASADPPPPEAAAVMSDPAVEGLPEQLLQQQPQPAISVSLV